MKIKFKEKYLSIDEFNEIELPDFTVLTGVNGSGKTHFLQAIEQGKVDVDGMEIFEIIHFNYENFKLENEAKLSAFQLTNEKDKAWDLYEKYIKNNSLSWKKELGEEYQMMSALSFEKNKSLWELNKKDFNSNSRAAYEKLKIYKKRFSRIFRENRNLQNNKEADSLLALIKRLPFSVDEINRQDFDDLYKPYDFKNDFLPVQLGKVIWDYYVKYDRNKVNEYHNEKYKTNLPVLTEDEFTRKYGEKPWELVDAILISLSSLDYKINSPENLSPYDNYQLKLMHTKRAGLEVNFGDLSSGERVLMALVSAVYKASSDKHFPSLLLLDEIDTSLHPSMIQNLLDVIHDIFLSRGVKVILVTHSPTTIAFASEDSVYVMNKEGKDRIVKTDKSDALRILTEGFATLDEGIKLFDQLSKKRLTVITEGYNTEYIKKALDYFGSDIKHEVEVISGIESRSGKEQLKTLYEFFIRVSHDNKVVFVWDPDMKSKLICKNNTTPYILDLNQENSKITVGIENLFDEDLFGDEFYVKKPKSDGGYHISLDKNKFKEHILANGTKADFIRFKPLIEKLYYCLNNKSD
jgi:energy-coupling factor transporter ATP-binding protein EcfA2